jgi:hypothetical protein
MQCMQFDDRDREARRALGFTISDDGEIARLVGTMQIELVRPVGGDQLSLSITLPTGESFAVMMPRDRLLEAAGIDEDEVA